MFLKESNVNEDFQPEVLAEDVIPDEASMMSIVMESEAEIANLRVSMIRLEHTAVVSEDTNLLNEGVKEFFQSVIEAIKKAWAAVVNWFKALWQRIQAWTGNVEAFLAKYRSKLAEIDPKGLKLEVYGAKAAPDVAGVLNNLRDINEEATLNKAPSGEKLKKLFAAKLGAKGGDFSTAIKNRLHNGVKAKKSQTITKADISHYVKVLESSKQFEGQIKAAEAAINAGYKEALAFAQKGLNASDAEKETYEKKVQAARAYTEVSDQVTAIIASVHSEYVSEALKVCRAALSHAGKAAPAKAEDKKEDAKKEDAKKEESTSLLSQFGLL